MSQCNSHKSTTTAAALETLLAATATRAQRGEAALRARGNDNSHTEAVPCTGNSEPA